MKHSQQFPGEHEHVCCMLVAQSDSPSAPKIICTENPFQEGQTVAIITKIGVAVPGQAKGLQTSSKIISWRLLFCFKTFTFTF